MRCSLEVCVLLDVETWTINILGHLVNEVLSSSAYMQHKIEIAKQEVILK